MSWMSALHPTFNSKFSTVCKHPEYTSQFTYLLSTSWSSRGRVSQRCWSFIWNKSLGRSFTHPLSSSFWHLAVLLVRKRWQRQPPMVRRSPDPQRCLPSRACEQLLAHHGDRTKSNPPPVLLQQSPPPLPSHRLCNLLRLRPPLRIPLHPDHQRNVTRSHRRPYMWPPQLEKCHPAVLSGLGVWRGIRWKWSVVGSWFEGDGCG